MKIIDPAESLHQMFKYKIYIYLFIIYVISNIVFN
jgi:hypothetical protein